MNLFKKKTCCCGDSSVEDIEKAIKEESKDGVKVLGTGCAKCQKLEDHVRKVVFDNGIDISIEHVTDFAQIASYGVMSTPGLVLNGEVVSFGKVLSCDEIEHIFHVKGLL